MLGQISAPLSEEQHTQHCQNHQKKGKKEKHALLTLLLFMFTLWLLGSTLMAPWSSIPICEGTTETAELFRVCATTFLFEIFFTVSKAA